MLDKEQIMREALDMSDFVGGSYQDVISFVLDNGKRGKNIYVKFPNKATLYSLLDDEDSCYQKIFGKDKISFQEEQRRKLEENQLKSQEEKKERLNELPSLVQRAKAVIYPQRVNEWEEDLTEVANKDSKIIFLMYKSALEIIEDLANKVAFEEVKNKMLYKQGHSNNSYYETLSIIAWYSKQGPDFLKYAEPKMAENSKDVLEIIEKENKQFIFEIEREDI